MNRIFIGIPCWRETAIWDKTLNRCADTPQGRALQKMCDHQGKFKFVLCVKARMNTPFCTNLLAEDFDHMGDAGDWFLLFSDDQILSAEDCEKMIGCAERFGGDIIGGIVTLKDIDRAWILAGNFGDKGDAVYYRRGIEITDEDVLKGRTKPVEWLGGACLIRHGVINAFRPSKNGYLPYWSFDRWPLSYDYRFFERAKRFGFKSLLQCGVLVGHVGIEGSFDGKDWQPARGGEPRIWNFWDSPVIENSEGVFPNQCTYTLDWTPLAQERQRLQHMEGAIIG